MEISNKYKKILIIGGAGGLAKITVGLLARKYPNSLITVVDNRPLTNKLKQENIKYKRMRYTRSQFEVLFHEESFDAVMHLGRMSHVSTDKNSIMQRLNQNLTGTSRILELCLEFSVKKIILLSTFHVYGALQDNPVFIKEEDSLKASIKHPELRDVVQMDQICTNWMWKNQKEISATVLRPCNIIGPQINNTMTQYLTTAFAPVPIDFNPMFQFIHEFDMANILVQSLEKLPTGVFNIAPNDVISLQEAKQQLNVKSIPTPISILQGVASAISSLVWKFPDYLLDYLKFSCIIDNTELKKHMGEEPFRYKVREALDLLKI
jgi:UDP-glucose 4-epimerase